jgi:O-antigen/teichoic acid export membrane protein
MSRTSVILRNIASNWVGFGINAAVTLVLTPFVLHQLGAARYGIWVLTSSIIGYYGFLDLGFRAGVTQYLTTYLAVRDYKRANECMSSAVAVLAGLGGVMLVLSLTAAYLAPHLFHVPPDMTREAFWCILVVGTSSAIQFALNPYGSVFTATQRFDLANAIGVVTRLMTAAAVALSLKLGQGLIGVSLATCSVSALDYIIRWRVATSLVPQLTVSTRYMSIASVREVSAFGAWNTLISINKFVYQHVPNILIGTMMPLAAVGHYALATGLTRQLNSILGPLPAVLYPAAAELHIQGDRERLQRLYHDGSRMTLLVLIPLVMAAGFWAPDFYRLWIGDRYVGHGQFLSVALIFQILLISTATGYGFSTAQQILIGAGRVRVVALSLISASAINLTLSFLLIRVYGLAGVAIATVAASAAIDMVALPLLLQHYVGLSLLQFARRACVRPLLAGMFQGAAIVAIRSIAPANSWPRLLTQGSIAAVVCGVILIAVGLSATERKRLIVNPLRRWTGRVWHARQSRAVTIGID